MELEFDCEFASALTGYSLSSAPLRRTRRDCWAITNGCENETDAAGTTTTTMMTTAEDGLSGLCASAFWDAHLSWPRDEFPDFTNCFLRSVLIWIPVAVLWLWAPFHLCRLRGGDGGYIPMSTLHRSKIAAWAFLLLTQLADLLFSVYLQVNEQRVAGVDFLAPILLLLTYSLVGESPYKPLGLRSG